MNRGSDTRSEASELFIRRDRLKDIHKMPPQEKCV
jgi:hypothetical protein